jgi:glycosyltransferase involved in cell wall biosynthesis
MPRVLYVTDSLSNGGAERQLSLLAKSLPNKWSPLVFSLGEGPFEDVILAAGIRLQVRTRRFRYDVSPAYRMLRLITRWRPDLIHSWGWMSSAACGPIAKALQIPFVDGTIRNAMKPAHLGALQQFGMHFADRIIANSAAGLAAWGVGSDRGRVVYNGFDLARCSPPVSRLTPRNKPFTVVMAARMSREKDFATFVEAARLLAHRAPRDWRFLAVGHGPTRAPVILLAEELIGAGVMEVPDAGLEALPFISQADVGVLLTDSVQHAEGCSNTILEYMACGLPVICSDTGGNREVVVDGITGHVIRDANACSVSACIDSICRNPALAKSMGTAGAERVRSTFTVEAMVRNTQAVYAEAMETTRRR